MTGNPAPTGVQLEVQTEERAAPARRRRRPGWRAVADAAACLVLAVASWALVAALLPSLGRAFNGDEGWRAFYVSRGRDFWQTLPHIDAPLGAGWVLLGKAAAAVLGNTELALRLPMLLCLPALALATYALARQVAGPAAALLAAAALALNNGLLLYATQFKQYTFEAFAAVLLLLCWLASIRERGPGWARTCWALGAGLCTVFAPPAFFLLLPLVAVDAVATGAAAGWSGLRSGRWWRERGLPRAATLAAALLPGAVHLATFVRLQSGRVGNAPNLEVYWRSFFLPDGGWALRLRWTLGQLAGFVPRAVTTGDPPPPDTRVPHVLPATASASALLRWAMVVALLAALAAARRNRAVRQLLVALVGALAVELALAGFDAWPFGWTRVNLFLVPLVYVLAAAGAAELAALGRGLAGPLAGVPGRTLARVAWTAPLGLAVAGLLALCGAGAWQALALGTNQLEGLRVDVMGWTWPEGMRAVARDVRVRGGPRDLAVVVIQGSTFTYYLEDYQGYPDAVRRRARIPFDHVYRAPRFADPGAAAFVAAHPGAPQVFLFEAHGVSGRLHGRQLHALERLGYQPYGLLRYPRAGLLTIFRRGGGAPVTRSPGRRAPPW
jgi:hypothetical protein